MRNVVNKALNCAWLITQLVIPFSIASDILNYFGVVEYLAFLFNPFTNGLDLPIGVALAFAAGFFFNLYAGIAVAAGLGLSAYEWTIVGTFLAICHSIPLETAVLNKVGWPINFHWIARLTNAFIGAWIVKKVTNSELMFTHVESIANISQTGFISFLFGSILSAILLAAKIIILVTFLVALFEFLRQQRRFKYLLDKYTYLSSLTVGGLLGVTYGAGILLKDIEQVQPKQKLLLLTFLMLAHGLVEETLIFGFFKADLGLIFLVRTGLALLAVAMVFTTVKFIHQVKPRRESSL